MFEISEVKKLLVQSIKEQSVFYKGQLDFNEGQKKFNQTIIKQISGLDTKIHALEKNMNSRFDEVYQKIDDVQLYLEKEISGNLMLSLNQQRELEEQVDAIDTDTTEKFVQTHEKIL